ncbi:MAG: DUF1858 domain-containing protein [Planctomycetota bacterium]|jgi:hypothetical protein
MKWALNGSVALDTTGVKFRFLPGRSSYPFVATYGYHPIVNSLPITPETKVAQLLQHYPELEETLIAMAPAFKKLRNPVLRRSVAKSYFGDEPHWYDASTIRATVVERELPADTVTLEPRAGTSCRRSLS